MLMLELTSVHLAIFSSNGFIWWVLFDSSRLRMLPKRNVFRRSDGSVICVNVTLLFAHFNSVACM